MSSGAFGLLSDMEELKDAWSKVFRRRRRRSWRYVSPRRRGVSALLLALLVTLTFAYWHFTDRRRIRQQAERFLTQLTGGHVKVQEARFSLFGAVVLESVTIDLDVDGMRKPFFHARTVRLRHRPWAVFVTGRLEPTEVICSEPSVTLPHDLEGIIASLAWKSKLGGGGWLGPLPPIHFRRGRLKLLDVETDISLLAARDVQVDMTPSGQDSYQIAFEGKQTGDDARIWGEFRLLFGAETWKVTFLEGSIPIGGLDEALPVKYRKWLRRYDVTGKLEPKSIQPAAAGRELLAVELLDVGLKLPEEEGGFALRSVTGALAFDAEGVTLRDVRGQIPEAGGARFSVSGRYDGFDPDSPFQLTLAVRQMSLPEGKLTGKLSDLLRKLRRYFDPQGQFDLTATVAKDSDGRVSYQGEAEPLGMSILYSRFPYRLYDVTGAVAFRPGLAEFRSLTGLHGGTRIKINGFLTGLTRSGTYDVTLKVQEGTELVFDRELREALPRRFVKIWDAINPTGSAAGVARVYRLQPNTPQITDIKLDLQGNASMTYTGFPYPLGALSGALTISNGNVRIESLRGARGSMRCRFGGSLVGLDTEHPQVDLEIRAWDAPIDDVFLAALGRRSPTAAAALMPGGTLRQLKATITRGPDDQSLDYLIEASLDRAGFTVADFPYSVTQATGELTIAPRKMTVHHLQGAHNATPITISGIVLLGGPEPAYDLKVDADGLELDNDLFSALQEDLKALWQRLGLAGTVDLELWIQRNILSQPTADSPSPRLNYVLSIDARDLQIRYVGFPYRLSGLSGKILATPGRMVLENLSSQKQQVRTSISGQVRHDASGVQADLSIAAEGLAVDEELLSAFPAELAPFVKRLRTGGKCSFNLQKASFERPPDVTGADGRPVTTDPASQITWDMEGEISFADVVMDLGFGPKRLTGRLVGLAGKKHAGLELAADVNLASMHIGKRSASDLEGRLLKSAASGRIYVKDLIAKAHGGRIAGYAEIDLQEPLEYGIRLDVEGIHLEELFAPDGSAEPPTAAVTGLLDGRLELTTVAGHPDRRRGSGVMRIAKARIYELPVFLGFLHVIYIALPSQAPLADGEMAYRIRGQTLVFDEIHLTGPTMSVVGSGTVDLATDRLALNFFAYTGPPGQLPRIADLDALLSGIVRELVEVQVTGTLARPKFRTVPLRSLEAAIRRLASPGDAGD